MLTIKTVKHGGFKELKKGKNSRTFAKHQKQLDTVFIYQYDADGIPTGTVHLTRKQMKQIVKMMKEEEQDGAQNQASRIWWFHNRTTSNHRFVHGTGYLVGVFFV